MKRRLLTIVSSWLAAAAFPLVAWAQPEEPYDPLEDMNRGIFWFNDNLDVYVLEPVARGYRDVFPDEVRTGIGNFFLNLRYPSYLVSDIFQGKFEQALDHTGRFLINSTIGVAGFIDFAKDMGLPDHEEDFGVTLASHGVPAGPYLMLPILGPSNVRDGVGRIVDAFLDPIGWIGYSNLSSSTKIAIAGGTLGLKLIHTRSGLLQAVEAAKESSLDYYGFMQGAYYQHRYGLMTDGAETDEFDSLSGEGDDLYDPSAADVERLDGAEEKQAEGKKK
jgi:phospholipid-binding lipoprotein MlaA